MYRIQTAGLGGLKPNTIVLGWPNSWRKKEEDSWRVFVDTIRNAAAAKMALLVPKGVQRYPDSGDKVKGVWVLFTFQGGGQGGQRGALVLPIFRATIKSTFSTNAQSKFAPVVLDDVLGPPRLVCHTPDGVLVSL